MKSSLQAVTSFSNNAGIEFFSHWKLILNSSNNSMKDDITSDRNSRDFHSAQHLFARKAIRYNPIEKCKKAHFACKWGNSSPLFSWSTHYTRYIIFLWIILLKFIFKAHKLRVRNKGGKERKKRYFMITCSCAT
jgi:hypothetical protein